MVMARRQLSVSRSVVGPLAAAPALLTRISIRPWWRRATSFDGLRHLGFVGDIQGEGLAPVDLLGDGFRRVAVDVGDGDDGAVGGKRMGGRPAKTGAGSR